MPLVTLDLPDDVARPLLALPEGTARNNMAAALLRDGIAAITGDDEETEEMSEDFDYRLTPEDIAALGRALADADAGRFVEPEIVFAEMRKRVGLGGMMDFVP